MNLKFEILRFDGMWFHVRAGNQPTYQHFLTLGFKNNGTLDFKVRHDDYLVDTMKIPFRSYPGYVAWTMGKELEAMLDEEAE